MRPYTVVQPDPQKLSEAGFGSAIDVPVIFARGSKYHEEANEFLYERCLGYWPPCPLGQEIPVTRASALTYARDLANVCEYLDARKIALSQAEYVTDLIGRYQKEMVAGSWSSYGKPLADTTINARVSRGRELLQWMADKGRRSAFHVPCHDATVYRGSAFDSHGHRGTTVSVPSGQIAVRPKALHLPTDQKLGIWLNGVHLSFGKTIALAVETVLHTALRKAELVGLRLDSIPRNPDEWEIVNPLAAPESQNILISVRYGTKGRQYGWDSGDKIGPTRQILVPLQLAKQIHEYIENDRPRALQKLFASYSGAALRAKLNDPHLFLDERNGEALSYSRFTHCWRSAPNIPCIGWSPHRGRHWWACMVLWRGIKEREAEIRARGESAGHHLILLGTQILQLEVQDQLGHLSANTTRRYIAWVSRQLSVALPKKYAEYMASADPAAQASANAEALCEAPE